MQAKAVFPRPSRQNPGQDFPGHFPDVFFAANIASSSCVDVKVICDLEYKTCSRKLRMGFGSAISCNMQIIIWSYFRLIPV